VPLIISDAYYCNGTRRSVVMKPRVGGLIVWHDRNRERHS